MAGKALMDLMWVKSVTDFLRFCHLNIPCLRINVTVIFMSFSSEEFTHLLENSKTDVFVGFQRLYLCPSKGHQNGVSIQSFTNLGKTFFRISRAYEIPHRSDSWRGFLYIYLLSFPDSGLSVLNGLHFCFDGVTVKTENW